ncbi:outer membrane protein transport protein [Limimaricola litoreus]|uniref:Outer membrane protein transport protein n=1 Tax=Limimaricola litoreus TaxID=2955316 RepID=A0A9X2FNH1_9RHOB|nr:outer membrane protein transport protein [Limimaricola litoreus]MCP1168334.1 outer membrane protein transport protein [Limimaricola litoreus]
MKLHFGATSAMALAAALTATGAGAIGLDRSNQDVTAIFEEGNVLELSFGKVFPELSGQDVALFGGGEYDNVGEDFLNVSTSAKMDFGNGFSGAVIIDQPFGADIDYPTTALALGGTMAQLDGHTITAVGRYQFNENVSVHAGFRRQTLEGDITLLGAAYGSLSGYSVALGENDSTGYLIGAAYEIPEIALRAALTYNSAIEHDFDTTEAIGDTVVSADTTTTVETPESWNLDLQTGIAPDTLAFANIRYAAYEDTKVQPAFFAANTLPGTSLTNIDDNYQVQVGVGRKFSEMFAGQVAIGFEPEGDERISPLDPTNGKRWVSLGGAYDLGTVTLSGGIRYTMLGDANPETRNPDGTISDRAVFNDNSAVAVGMSVAYRF